MQVESSATPLAFCFFSCIFMLYLIFCMIRFRVYKHSLESWAKVNKYKIINVSAGDPAYFFRFGLGYGSSLHTIVYKDHYNSTFKCQYMYYPMIPFLTEEDSKLLTYPNSWKIDI